MHFLDRAASLRPPAPRPVILLLLLLTAAGCGQADAAATSHPPILSQLLGLTDDDTFEDFLNGQVMDCMESEGFAWSVADSSGPAPVDFSDRDSVAELGFGVATSAAPVVESFTDGEAIQVDPARMDQFHEAVERCHQSANDAYQARLDAVVDQLDPGLVHELETARFMDHPALSEPLAAYSDCMTTAGVPSGSPFETFEQAVTAFQAVAGSGTVPPAVIQREIALALADFDCRAAHLQLAYDQLLADLGARVEAQVGRSSIYQ